MLIPLLLTGLLGYTTYKVSKEIANSAHARRSFSKGKKNLAKLLILQHLRKTRKPDLGLTLKERSYAARIALDGNLPMTAYAFDKDNELPLSETWPGAKQSIREYAEDKIAKMSSAEATKLLAGRREMTATIVGVEVIKTGLSPEKVARMQIQSGLPGAALKTLTRCGMSQAKAREAVIAIGKGMPCPHVTEMSGDTTAQPSKPGQEIQLAATLLEERLKSNPDAIFDWAGKKRFRKRDYGDLINTLHARTKGSPIAPAALYVALSKKGVVSVMGAFRLGRLGRIGRIGQPDINWARRSNIIANSIPVLR